MEIYAVELFAKRATEPNIKLENELKQQMRVAGLSQEEIDNITTDPHGWRSVLGWVELRSLGGGVQAIGYSYGDSELVEPIAHHILTVYGERAHSNLPDAPAEQIARKATGSAEQVQATEPVHTSPGSILIVTVTKVEAQAVRQVFCRAFDKDWTRKHVGNKTYYDLGAHGNVQVFMVQSEMGTATPGGALLTVRQAIDDLKPQAVIMCGIAFGARPDKQHLGDILIAKQLWCYEPQKVDNRKGQTSRGDRPTASARLLDRFRSADLEWKGAKTHFGLVLSGEKLVNDPKFRDRLLKNEPEAIGGEMEGAGLYAVAHETKVDWILVKAICDWADGKKADNAQRSAAENAASFVLHVLQRGGWSG